MMSKTLRTLISSSLLSGALACASAPPPPPPKPVEAARPEVRSADPRIAANQAFAKGDYPTALKEYDALLRSNPNDEQIAFNRLVTLQKLGRHDEAGQGYQSFLAEHPDHADATVNLGAVLRGQGKVDEAISLYNKVLKKDPYNSRVLNNLVVLYRDKKDYRSAIQAVRTLLMRDQHNIDAYKNLALVYYDQQKYRLTLTILGNALKMAEEQKVKDPDIHVNLGLAHLALGDKGKAMLSFKKAVELDPGHLVGNYNIGALALAHRDYNLATKCFEAVSKAWPNDAEVAAFMGYAYQGQGKFAESAQWLEKARSLGPKSEEPIVMQLMVVWQAAEQPAKALEYGNQLLKIQNKLCGADEMDGICGRIKGIQLMLDMKNRPPPAEEKKPKATGNVEGIFTDAPAEGDEAAPPPEEGAPPAEGAQPTEGEAPKN